MLLSRTVTAMDNAETGQRSRYPMLELTDEELLKEIFSALSKSVSSVADPYSEDGSYAAAIGSLPVGLRAMAATHHLDISLTVDDIGWHFLNFGEPGLVRETEAGLHELGLDEIADYFVEAHGIVTPIMPEVKEAADYYECLESRGLMERINELTDKASAIQPTLSGSPIYAAWTKYARAHPEKVCALVGDISASIQQCRFRDSERDAQVSDRYHELRDTRGKISPCPHL
jgi:hypothetical protein